MLLKKDSKIWKKTILILLESFDYENWRSVQWMLQK